MVDIHKLRVGVVFYNIS